MFSLDSRMAENETENENGVTVHVPQQMQPSTPMSGSAKVSALLRLLFSKDFEWQAIVRLASKKAIPNEQFSN